ncbi:hypothetical protein DICA3_E27534 [Diutina catenulata]
MVFAFIKNAKHHKRVEFFHASYRYFTNPNAITQWFPSHPQSSWSGRGSGASQNFLKIDVGHYGLYFSMWGHDRDQKGAQPVNELILAHMAGYESSKVVFEHIVVVCDKLIITKANLDIHTNILRLKSAARSFASPLSLIFQGHRRMLHTSSKTWQRKPAQAREPREVREPRETHSSPNNHAFPDTQPDGSSGPASDPASSSSSIDPYLASQLHSLRHAHDHMVYPIYQSIVRNGFTLTSADDYHFVLASIARRELDGGCEVDAIERKLTALMTVYQDMVAVVKPSATTMDVVIGALCRGAVAATAPSNQFAEAADANKPAEFAELATTLYLSTPHRTSGAVAAIAQVASKFPQVITPAVAQALVHDYRQGAVADPHYWCHLVACARAFARCGVSSTDAYQFIFAAYAGFREVGASADEFAVYKEVVAALVANGQAAAAGKLLDDILGDYKRCLEAGSPAPSKSQVGAVISAYLGAMVERPEKHAINTSLGLLRKFERIPYLPEVAPEVYSQFIVTMCHRYRQLGATRTAGTSAAQVNEVLALQASYYANAWKLYGRVAVRPDFVPRYPARDAVLSLALDVGDHPRVFEVLKEVLLRSHQVYDVATLRKLMSYLYAGATQGPSGPNPQYAGLLVQVVEGQAQFYAGPALADYLSEVARFLVVHPVPADNAVAFARSAVVQRALDTMDLQNGNLFGVSVVAQVLMGYPVGGAETGAVARLLALVVYQFEDPDNHYVELNDELRSVKAQAREYVAAALKELPSWTPEMVAAAQHVDVPVPASVEVAKHRFEPELDLSYLLAVCPEAGMAKFHAEFARGSFFSPSTWHLVLTREYLEDTRIAPKQLIARVFASDGSPLSAQLAVLEQMLRADHDPTSVAAAAYVMKHPELVGDAPSVVSALVATAASSQNRRLSELVTGRGGLMYRVLAPYSAAVPVWAAQYLSVVPEPATVVDLVENTIMAQGVPPVAVAMAYLQALVALKDWAKFGSVFATFEPQLMESELAPATVTLALQAAMAQPGANYHQLASEYARHQGSTPELDALVAQCRVYAGEPLCTLPVPHCRSVSELAWVYLGCDGLEQMRTVARANKHVVSIQHAKGQKEALVAALFGNLAASVRVLPVAEVTHKFNNTLKFLRMVHLHKLSVANMGALIALMGMARLDELLHILKTKMVAAGSVADVVQFFYLETWAKRDADKHYLVRQLQTAFASVDDAESAEELRAVSPSH